MNLSSLLILTTLDSYNNLSQLCTIITLCCHMVYVLLSMKYVTQVCNKVRKEGRKQTGLAREDSGEFYLQINLNRCALCAS